MTLGSSLEEVGNEGTLCLHVATADLVNLPLEAGTGQALHSLASAASEQMCSRLSPTRISISRGVTEDREERAAKLRTRQIDHEPQEG